MSNDFTVLAPAFYKDWSKVKYLKQSAERWNVPITFYGFDEPYKGWHDVQIDRLIIELEKLDTECVLYTDASDALINDTFKFMPESQIEFSVEADGNICAGGWYANRLKILEILRILKDFKPCKDCGPDTMNPQTKWRCFLKWTGDDGVFRDYGRLIFQVADEPLEIKDNRVYNPRTNSTPFIVHWAGGYTDPEAGKAALIEPYWRQLGY